MKDYYRILQVHPEASLEVMNGAYRSLVKQCHPDQFHTSRKAVMTEKMQEINEAYRVLSNPSSRSEFDRRYKKQGVPPQPATPPRTLSTQLKSVLFWTTLSYLALTFLVKPLLGSPLIKVIFVLVLMAFFVHIYRKQKQHK